MPDRIGFLAASDGSSPGDAFLNCIGYSAVIAALCFGAAIAWALRRPAGRERHAAVLAGAAAASIVLFWVALSATLPRTTQTALNYLSAAATLQILGHASLGFLLWRWLGRRAEPMQAPFAPSAWADAPVAPPAEPVRPAPPVPPPEAHASAPPPAAKPTPPRTLFISYRRVDSSDVTGRIYDRLVASHSRDHVFKDVDSIPLGTDFRHHVAALIEQSDCMLAVIGRQWLDAADGAGRRRLDDPTDLVRIEIEAALARGVPVIPLLVQGALMPEPQSLPEALRPLAFRNGMSVRADPDFHRDLDRLDEQLRLLASAGLR